MGRVSPHETVPVPSYSPPFVPGPTGVVAGDPVSARSAADADMTRLGALDWTAAMASPFVARALAADGRPGDLMAEEAGIAFDALGDHLAEAVASRADVRRNCFAGVSYLVASSAGPGAGVVSLTSVEMTWRGASVWVAGRSTGLVFTRHALERRYERKPGFGMASVAMARELAPQVALLRLVARESHRAGIPDVAVPLPGGMLFGFVRPAWDVDHMGSATFRLAHGVPKVNPTSPSWLAADGLRWTGATYVDADMFGTMRDRYSSFWADCLSHPDLAWLSGIRDWGFADKPHSADRLASLRADLAPKVQALLAMSYGKGLAPSRRS